jgi:hypothetical protein
MHACLTEFFTESCILLYSNSEILDKDCGLSAVNCLSDFIDNRLFQLNFCHVSCIPPSLNFRIKALGKKPPRQGAGVR